MLTRRAWFIVLGPWWRIFNLPTDNHSPTLALHSSSTGATSFPVRPAMNPRVPVWSPGLSWARLSQTWPSVAC